ncbi:MULTISPECIES: STAS-like domain-containing protein [Lactiplantibacillus]|uniref:STAS-like domain-containing protein n=1 Tax=Lactiplantibacillus TaxID=2767842 RepID=UPI001C1FE5EA|nr:MULTISPECIES: STAS-like domain-containing protein [Lactiplantibacillus]MBU7448674.1 STAS-like domain-containing protein [Lactiplantibacillus sp. 7.2.4]MBU7481866.1 STAS-like domain-containing protein [Lactiplantibacillus pentosus]
MKILKVRDEIKTPLAVTADKANYIYKSLSDSVANKETVSVDFSGITTLTTAFLNIAIGQLYSIGDKHTLNEYVKIDGNTLTSLQRDKVRLVMENAKNKLSDNDINEDLYHGN